MKKIIYVALAIVLIASILLVLRINKKSNRQKTDLASIVSAAVAVKIEVVKEENFSTAFLSNGTLDPVKELSFVSDVAGRVVSIEVEKGSRVSKGQMLVMVDDEMLRADFMASEASYKGLKTDYERFKNANENGGVTDQQMDNIRTQVIAAESRYLSSKRRLSDATIKAPIGGTINEKYIEVGTYLNPGVRLFDIVDDSRLKLQCNVSEQQVLGLSRGQKVRIGCNTFPEEEFSGVISFIGAKAGKGLSYPVEIRVDDKKDLKAGMYVTTFFELQSGSKGLLIPRSAVSGSVKSANVYIVKNGMAHKRDVVAGTMIDKRVEILSGLQAGDSIVVAGLINVSEGAKVINKK
jgi:membrane fusion protein, multidrug efflux system